MSHTLRVRVALAASLVLGLMGCGPLSANSSRSMSQIAANGLFHGAMALASTPHASGERAPALTRRARAPSPTRRYLCTDERDEERTVRARSRALAEIACGPGCGCDDPVMSEELRLYRRRSSDDAY